MHVVLANCKVRAPNMTFRWRMVLLELSTFLLLNSIPINAQNATCFNNITHLNGINTICAAGGYDLPGNFDVALLDPTINGLLIQGPDQGEVNVVHSNPTPLPFRGKLNYVLFHNFNQLPDHPRFPLNQLLLHNRYHIETLVLRKTKLETLTSDDFRGFKKLLILLVGSASLTSVSTSTFAELGVLPSGEMLSSYEPKLIHLFLLANPQLDRLDWSFLVPVSKNLVLVSVGGTGVTANSLTCSTHFTLESAYSVSLQSNQLDRLPSAVYNTFNNQQSIKFNLDGQVFCPDEPDCSCCEMEDFSQWLRTYKHMSVESLTCGKYGKPTSSRIFLGNPDLHAHCAGATTKPPSISVPIQPATGCLDTEYPSFGVGTTCSAGDYKFPGSFGVSKLHTGLVDLTIEGDGNVADEKSIPFPYRQKLTWVNFSNFNQLPEHPRFPLNALMINNRRQIRNVFLKDVKLISLRSDDFRGFNTLQLINIEHAGLTSVSASTFSELGMLPIGETMPGYKSILNSVAISGNGNLESLNWSFLMPVRQTLKMVQLLNNGLVSSGLFSSIPFTLDVATFIALDNNNLRYLPSAIYQTLNPAITLHISLGGQTLCPGTSDTDYNCACCEMQGFTQWLTQNNQTDAVKAITCGIQGGSININHGPRSYDHCLPSLPPVTMQPIGCPSVEAPTSSVAVAITCFNGTVTMPTIQIDDVEATRIEFIGDHSRKCVMLSYGLHDWLLEQSSGGLAAKRVRRSVGEPNDVAVSCKGRGVVAVNQHDSDAVHSSNIHVDTAITKKCRAFFYELFEQVVRLSAAAKHA